MWRSLFLALGVTLMIIGGECLVVEQAVFAQSVQSAPSTEGAAASPGVVEPPDWAPWTLISAGAVVCIYSFTIPRRLG